MRVRRGRIHGRRVSPVQADVAHVVRVRADRELDERAQAVVRRASTAAHEPEQRVQHRHSQSATASYCRSGVVGAGVGDGEADESAAQSGLQFGQVEHSRVEHERAVERADARNSDQATLSRT